MCITIGVTEGLSLLYTCSLYHVYMWIIKISHKMCPVHVHKLLYLSLEIENFPWSFSFLNFHSFFGRGFFYIQIYVFIMTCGESVVHWKTCNHENHQHHSASSNSYTWGFKYCFVFCQGQWCRNFDVSSISTPNKSLDIAFHTKQWPCFQYTCVKCIVNNTVTHVVTSIIDMRT